MKNCIKKFTLLSLLIFMAAGVPVLDSTNADAQEDRLLVSVDTTKEGVTTVTVGGKVYTLNKGAGPLEIKDDNGNPLFTVLIDDSGQTIIREVRVNLAVNTVGANVGTVNLDVNNEMVLVATVDTAGTLTVSVDIVPAGNVEQPKQDPASASS